MHKWEIFCFTHLTLVVKISKNQNKDNNNEHSPQKEILLISIKKDAIRLIPILIKCLYMASFKYTKTINVVKRNLLTIKVRHLT